MYESALHSPSETLRVQEELAHQLELTRNITENVAEGLCLMDGAGRLTYMNPAAEQLLGWTQEELLGRKRAPGEGSTFCLRLPRAVQG